MQRLYSLLMAGILMAGIAAAPTSSKAATFLGELSGVFTPDAQYSGFLSAVVTQTLAAGDSVENTTFSLPALAWWNIEGSLVESAPLYSAVTDFELTAGDTMSYVLSNGGSVDEFYRTTVYVTDQNAAAAGIAAGDAFNLDFIFQSQATNNIPPGTLFVDGVAIDAYNNGGGPSPVPVPASLPLMVGGLGLMGWMARRRRKTV